MKAFAGVALLLGFGLPTHAAPADDSPALDRLLLVMAADASINRPDLRGARSGVYRQSRRYPGLPSDMSRTLDRIAREHGLRRVDSWPMATLGVHCVVFEAPPEVRMDVLLEALSADPAVESAQRMNRFELRGEARAHDVGDDPYRAMQRSLEALDVPGAPGRATGKGVRVAVIDTGVAAAHPDLDGQVVARERFVAGDGEGDRHGTAVAGLIAARAGNGIGIAGIAPGARILALQACEEQAPDGRGGCTSFSLARAIDRAVSIDADILNLSIGGPEDRLIERLLVQAMARNVVVVAAAGEGELGFPSALEGVIAAAAVDSKALVAPGSDVLSLVPPDGYDYFSGNSIAAAQVSGVVALLRERAPTLAAAEIRRVLARTSRPAGDVAARLVSACAALAEIGRDVGCRG